MRRVLSVLGLCLVMALPVSLPTTARSAPLLAAPLHTSGNQIYDASNQPVRLKGLNRAALGMPGTSMPITDDEMTHARLWGANIVRVTVNEDEWTQLCPFTSYEPAYK